MLRRAPRAPAMPVYTATSHEQATMKPSDSAAALAWPAPDAPPPAATAEASYREITPAELRAMPALVVVALKVPRAEDIFRSFRGVLSLSCSRELEPHLEALPPAAPLAVVCPDGEHSGHLALRLAQRGYTVYHVAGGLREWHFCNRQACSA